MKKIIFTIAAFALALNLYAQQPGFNGLDMNMGNLSKLSDAQTRSISPENFTGEKGKGGMADPVKDKDKKNAANASNAARDLGQGWKINPYVNIEPGETVTLAEMSGPGASSAYLDDAYGQLEKFHYPFLLGR